MSKQVKQRRGIVFIVASPSGGGKTTICHRILDCDPLLHFSVSYTSRKPRESEREGIDYHFVSDDEFKRKSDRGDFLECAVVHGHYYGTDRIVTERILERGKDVLMDIDVQGADMVKRALPDAVRIFILPPSRDIMKQRLQNRGTESREQLERRLSIAAKEIEHWQGYDYAVINDDLEEAVEEVRSIIRAERSSLRHDMPDVRETLRSFGVSL